MGRKELICMSKTPEVGLFVVAIVATLLMGGLTIVTMIQSNQIERLERWQEIDRENSQRNSQSNAVERIVLQTRIVELYRELGRQAEFGEGGIMLPEHLWELWSELHQMTAEEFREAELEFWLYHWLGE